MTNAVQILHRSPPSSPHALLSTDDGGARSCPPPASPGGEGEGEVVPRACPSVPHPPPSLRFKHPKTGAGRACRAPLRVAPRQPPPPPHRPLWRAPRSWQRAWCRWLGPPLPAAARRRAPIAALLYLGAPHQPFPSHRPRAHPASHPHAHHLQFPLPLPLAPARLPLPLLVHPASHPPALAHPPPPRHPPSPPPTAVASSHLPHPRARSLSGCPPSLPRIRTAALTRHAWQRLPPWRRAAAGGWERQGGG